MRGRRPYARPRLVAEAHAIVAGDPFTVGLIAILAGAPRAAAAQPAGMHPQALTDQVGLDRLRAACTADHAWLADLLKPFMERYVDGTVEWRGLGAYAGGRV